MRRDGFLIILRSRAAMKRVSQSIVLRRVAYGDADWIVTFFTRDMGRLSGMAKSARLSQRRFGGALEPGSVVDMRYSMPRSHGLARLEEAQVLVPMNGAMKTLERLGAVARSLALALAFLQEHEPNPGKFDLLRDRLTRLSASDPTPNDLAAYELRWLALCGYAPEISRCARCGDGADGGDGWSFDFARGGFCCYSCRPGPESVGLSIAAHKGFESLAKGGETDEVSSEAAARVLARYIDHLLGRPLGVR